MDLTVIEIVGFIITVVMFFRFEDKLRLFAKHLIIPHGEGSFESFIKLVNKADGMITNEEHFKSNRKRFFKHVYWSLLPTSDLTFIHFYYLSIIRALQNLEFSVTILLGVSVSGSNKEDAKTTKEKIEKTKIVTKTALVRSYLKYDLDLIKHPRRELIDTVIRTLKVMDKNELEQWCKHPANVQPSHYDVVQPIFDIAFAMSLRSSVVIAGNDEKDLWVNVLSRAYNNYKIPPVVIVLPILPGLDGSNISPSDSKNTISLNDTSSTIKAKLNQTSVSDQTLKKYVSTGILILALNENFPFNVGNDKITSYEGAFNVLGKVNLLSKDDAEKFLIDTVGHFLQNLHSK